MDEWRRALFDDKADESTLELTPPKRKRRRWPWAAAAAVLLLVIFAVWNKQSADRTDAPESMKQQLRRDFEAQFRSADANADGYLSPDEVRGRFPGIAREFARADSDNDGRISMREFLQVRRMQLERKFQAK